ncbi:MAG: tyrosine-type recombinase/integrase [Candidatus Dormibacteria bacterium]|jgi:site-specific recombinase XerD
MAVAEYPRPPDGERGSPPRAAAVATIALPLAALPDSVPEVQQRAAAAATHPEASAELRILGRFLLHHRAATASEYCRDILAFARWCKEKETELFQVDRTTVELWVLSMQAEGIMPRTLRRRLAAVQGFYLEAVDAGVIGKVPTLRVKRPPVGTSAKSGIGREEAALLLEAAEDAGPRDELLIRLLLLNGLRASEVAQLTIGDVGDERGHRTIRVRRKGGRVSVEALSPGTRHALDRLLQQPGHTDPEAPLIADPEGNPLSRHGVARITHRLGRAVGITAAGEPPLNPHELRHSFITLGLDAGASLRDMQRAAAHADPRTTADYDRRRKALDTHPSYLVERYLS